MYGSIIRQYTGWRTECHTIDCTRNTFLLLQKHLTSGTELILIGWKIVPNEEPPFCLTTSCKRTLTFVTTFQHKSSESARHNFTMWALSCATFSGLPGTCSSLGTIFQPMRINSVPDVKCFCNNKNVLHAQSMA